MKCSDSLLSVPDDQGSMAFGANDLYGFGGRALYIVYDGLNHDFVRREQLSGKHLERYSRYAGIFQTGRNP